MHAAFGSTVAGKKPSLILCLGNVAVQSFFRDSEAEVKTLRGSWHEVQGYPTTVAYHPLAVRRRPNLHSLFMQDLALVAERFHRLDPRQMRFQDKKINQVGG